MSNEKKPPWGNVVAVIAGAGTGGTTDADNDTQYIQVGVAWLNEKDGKKSFALTLDVEPIAWRDPYCRRTLLIQQRRAR